MNKIFLYIFTGRRNFRPLFPLLFLSYSGNTVEQLGFLIVAGTLASLVMEIPSGYISDRFGYRKTLILGKMCMIFSTLIFIYAETFWIFAIGNFLFTTALAFRSGTLQAYAHDLLESMHLGDQYGKIMAKLRGNVSLLSVFFIIGLPLLYAIEPLYPFYIALGIDLLGLIGSFFLKNPNRIVHQSDEKQTYQSIPSLLGVFFRSKKFLTISVIVGLMWTLYLSAGSFKEPYLTSIGYPVAWIGLVMGGSRFVWFVLGRGTKYIKDQLSLYTLLIADTLILGGGFLLISLLYTQWIVTAGLLICMIGYYYVRAPFYTQHLFAVLPNKNYKATFLSMKAQLEGLMGIVLPVGMGYCMAVGYNFGFMVAGFGYILIGVVGYGILKRIGI